jgi:hypothetical protein
MMINHEPEPCTCRFDMRGELLPETECDAHGIERDQLRAENERLSTELESLKTNHLNKCDGFNCAYCNWVRTAEEVVQLREALEKMELWAKAIRDIAREALRDPPGEEGR